MSILGRIFGTDGYDRKRENPGMERASQDLGSALLARAQGKTPSYAEEVTRNALGENLQAQQQGIRSIGGVSGALKQRMIANAAARSGSEIARRGGEAALAERNDAMDSYTKFLGGEQKAEQDAYEKKQEGKRTLWTAAGQGAAAAMGKK